MDYNPYWRLSPGNSIVSEKEVEKGVDAILLLIASMPQDEQLDRKIVNTRRARKSARTKI